MTALLLTARDHLGFRLLDPTFSISCGADYFTMALTCSVLAGTVNSSSPVKSPYLAKYFQMKSNAQLSARVRGEDTANGAESEHAYLKDQPS